MSKTHPIKVEVNAQSYDAEVPGRLLLADFLREDLLLWGTHLGCEQGVCGACTVLLDGEPVRACLMLAVQANGASITTVESLAVGEELSPLQEAFRKHHALQCGFCTPGFLMTVEYLLRSGEDLETEANVREAISGNLCRCTGYQNIVDAVMEFAERQDRDR